MNTRKLISLLLALAMLFTLAACNKDTGSTPSLDDGSASSSGSGSASASSSGDDTPAPDEPETYTMNESLASMPDNWSPHSWETNADSYVTEYTEIGFAEIGYTKNADGEEAYQWLYEMATNIEDVTSTYDASKFGVSKDESNRVYKISLNPDACWADGTPINADSYIYSMQQCLNPEMKNYRANLYYSGEGEIVGAFNYYNSGTTSWVENSQGGVMTYPQAEWVANADGQYCAPDGTLLFFSLYAGVTDWMGGSSLKDYSDYFVDNFAALEALADEDGYVPVTDESIDLLFAFTSSDDWGNETMDDIANYVSYEFSFPVASWDDVGVLKTGDYELTYILKYPCSMFNFLINMSSTWLVYEPLYEAGKSSESGLVTTNYGTGLDNYMGYGPYKLVSFETDKQMVFEKNENWYGYHDGKHEGQYQTTKIVCDIVSDHDTILQLFNSGKLDSIELTSDDMDTYRFSDNLLKTDESYTYRFFFATERDTLIGLQEAASSSTKKVNKVCLSYDDFRQAFAYAIDRDDFVLKGTAGSKKALGLLNGLYYYDVENDPYSIYRNTDEAKAGICEAYGTTWGEGGDYATLDEAYAACTGYDLNLAKSLFSKAYDEMVANGDWTDDMVIELNCPVTAGEITASVMNQNQLMQSYLDAATVGTGFEGKITITYLSDDDRYAAVPNGEYEMGYGAWGGAEFYPFRSLDTYCDPDKYQIQETCGFDPTTESATLNVNGEDVTKTYQQWSLALNAGGEYDMADINVKLKILADLEKSLIQQWHFAVVCSLTTVSIYSYKIQYITTNFNIMYGYGGIRYITYNYSDSEWEAFVAEQGTLDYT